MDTIQSGGVTREFAGGKMLAAKEDGIGLITFNQPEKRNAMSLEMWTGLGEILDEFREDDSVRVVILTGAGSKAFVSGADISQFDFKVGERGRGRVTIGNGGIQPHARVGVVQQSQHLTLLHPYTFLGVHASDTSGDLGGNRGAPPRRYVAARIQKCHSVVAPGGARHRNLHQGSLALQHNENS